MNRLDLASKNYRASKQAIDDLDSKIEALQLQLLTAIRDREKQKFKHQKVLEEFQDARLKEPSNPKSKITPIFLLDVFQCLSIPELEKSRFVCMWWNQVFMINREYLPCKVKTPAPQKKILHFLNQKNLAMNVLLNIPIANETTSELNRLAEQDRIRYEKEKPEYDRIMADKEKKRLMDIQAREEEKIQEQFERSLRYFVEFSQIKK